MNAFQELTAMEARLRGLERDVEALARQAAERPYQLPAASVATREEASYTRSTADFRSGTSIDTVSDQPTPEELVPRSLRVVWSCRSLAGTATLVGITGYKPTGNTQTDLDPEAPWQYRKWAKRTLAGSRTLTDLLLSCAGACYDAVRLDYSGDYIPGVASATLDDYRTCLFVFSATLGVSEINDMPRSFQGECADASASSRVAATFTLTEAVAFVCSGYECAYWNSPPAGDVYRQRTTTETETLGEEQSFYQALLAAGGAEEGTSCCTELTAATLLPPESVDDLPMTGRGVEVDYMVEGGDPLLTYAVAFTLFQGEDESEEVIDAPGGTPLIYTPPLPALTDPASPPICVTNVRVLGLVEEE